MRQTVAKLLYAQRVEIERATITRVCAISDPREISDSVYTEGLRATVVAALEYAVLALEHSEDDPPPVPTELLAQARLAARSQVCLTTVLRRYFAGYMLLEDFLVREIDSLRGTDLQRVLRGLAALFDRVLAAVSNEYSREADSRPEGPEQRRAERIERLLRSEPVDTSGFVYDFEAWHLGAIASGHDSERTLRELFGAMSGNLMIIRHSNEVVWAWVGSRLKLEHPDLQRLALAGKSSTLKIAIGEPAKGLAGWRLTHRQARAGLPVALRDRQNVARYADVAVVASVLQDGLLVESLRDLYLTPLETERERAYKTLQAYFDSARSVSSAAATLGVSRKTVGSRLQAIEAKLGRSIDSCALQLEVAVRLWEIRSDARTEV